MKRFATGLAFIIRNAFVKLLENALSKKFLVFITATVLLSLGLIPPDLWVAVALAVLGVVSAIDFKQGTRSLHGSSAIDGPPPEYTEIP